MTVLMTKKKEAFAQAVAAGATLADAYRQTRDCSMMQASTVRANAKKLAREPALKGRIEELRRESERESKAGDFPRSIACAGARDGRESSASAASAQPRVAPEPASDQAANAEKPFEEAKPRGRPTVYTEELAMAILARLAKGEPLRTICRDEGMPDESTVRAWALDPKHPIATRYAKAREMGFYSLADELLEIADDGRNDYVERMTRSGEVERVVDEEAISRARMRIETRKWLLAKALPHAFGDKIEHAGGIRVEDTRPKTPSQDHLAELSARFLGGLARHHPERTAELAAQTGQSIPQHASGVRITDAADHLVDEDEVIISDDHDR